jgi:hypothetical protein
MPRRAVLSCGSLREALERFEMTPHPVEFEMYYSG